MYIFRCMHECKRSYVSAYIHIPAYMHTCIGVNIHMYTYIDIYTCVTHI